MIRKSYGPKFQSITNFQKFMLYVGPQQHLNSSLIKEFSRKALIQSLARYKELQTGITQANNNMLFHTIKGCLQDIYLHMSCWILTLLVVRQYLLLGIVLAQLCNLVAAKPCKISKMKVIRLQVKHYMTCKSGLVHLSSTRTRHTKKDWMFHSIAAL